jgi:GNAT superfamily N-acetyltransferase
MNGAQPKLDFLTPEPVLDECYGPGYWAEPSQMVNIRRYQKSDREAVRTICCDTGFLGNPIDPIYRDRELFADLITNPYLDYEPEWTLVAEADGQVAGYILGSVKANFSRTLMFSGFQTACKMLSRLLTNKYQDHPRSELFVRWVLTKGLMEQPHHPEGAAHLHVNVKPEYRQGVVSRRLWHTFEKSLRQAGLNHYYGQFFSCTQRNLERVYARFGLKTYDRSETTMFYPEIPYPVSIVCAHKFLDNPVFQVVRPLKTLFA